MMKTKYHFLVWGLLLALVLLAGVGTAVVIAAPALNSDHNPTDQALIDAVTAATHWMVTTQQNPDGGYGIDFSTGEPASNAPATLDAIVAIAVSGHNPANAFAGQTKTPVDYLTQNVTAVADYAATDGAAAGKTIIGLQAGNQNPRDFQGYNFVISLTQQLQPDGRYNVDTAFGQATALLGVATVNEQAPPEAIQWLLHQQAGGGDLDGSWDDGFGTAGNPDATAMAIMALVAGGVAATDANLVRAREFLARSQLADGGWEYGQGYGANANSTALALLALLALKEDVHDLEGDWARNGHSPVAALLEWQNSTSGAFQADFGQGPFDDFFATVQAIPAAAGAPLPIAQAYGPVLSFPPDTVAEPATTAVSNSSLYLIVGGLVLLVLAGAFWLRPRPAAP
jgi:hypothetical protein